LLLIEAQLDCCGCARVAEHDERGETIELRLFKLRNKSIRWRFEPEPRFCSVEARCSPSQMSIIHSREKRIAKARTDYVYGPLNTQRDEIRLLEIQPSRRSKSPISCSLRAVSLDDVPLPKYAALSYCWGEGPADQPINCDGSTVWITDALFDALRSLRELTRTYLWIDQICINQTDLEERSSQVQLMRRIYPGAVKTFLHISRSDDFPEALHHYVRLNSGLTQQPDFLPNTLRRPWISLSMNRWRPRLVLHDLKGGSRDGGASAFFTHRPCFARAWILQEKSLSCEVQVICRNIVISWDRFERIVQGYSTRMKRIPDPPERYGSFPVFNRITQTVETRDGNTLFNLLVLSDTMRASDPRDRIYALLGLASDAQEFPRPDYTLSVAEVYQSFASAFVAKGLGPQMLALASRVPSDRSYPSWIPDWQEGFIGFGLEQFSDFSSGRDDKTFDVRAGTSVLSAKGLIVDTILRTFSLDTEHVSTDHEHEGLLELVRNTATAIQNDSQRSKSPFCWSSAADLHLKLILCLVFDHDGGEYLAASPRVRRLDFDGLASKLLLTAKAPSFNSGYNREADKPTVAEDLSDHVGRGYGKKDRSISHPLQHLAQRGGFATTLAGRLCLIPLDVQPGDKIAIILGCRAPYVLREDCDGYLTIGETYIRGLMHGEALDDGRYTVREILIH